MNCPSCGFQVSTPIKTLLVPSHKRPKHGEEVRLIGVFECPNCKARFRSEVRSDATTQNTVSIKDMVGRIKGIKEELMQTLMNLRDKIRTLETERANLMSEIEKLRGIAESRASALESEVNMLREEVRSLKDILGCAGEEK